MLEEKIKVKRKQLNESIEKNRKYEDVYKLSVELDDLITEFYKESKKKKKRKIILKRKKNINKILYIAYGSKDNFCVYFIAKILQNMFFYKKVLKYLQNNVKWK